MEKLEMKEAGMNWVKKRPFAYVFGTLMCLLGLGFIIWGIVAPPAEPGENETALVLGGVVFLFFFCVVWLRVIIRENRETEITLLHDPERLILRKDGEQMLNAAWDQIKNIRSRWNGRHVVAVDFTYLDAQGQAAQYVLETAYLATEDIAKMVEILRINWADKYGRVKQG